MPIALFVHKITGEVRTDKIEEVALRIEQRGIDAWFDLDPAELLGTEAADYDKITDTLDVWFDSGVTHSCVLGQRAELGGVPADLYLEGSDQHRGWFQSSLLTSVAMRGAAPYKSVLTHGFTVDAKGQKMSKSKGNVVAPQKVINSLGADILRLWVASTDYRGEMNVSDEILKRMADSYRRIRNTTRFLLANLGDFDPSEDSVPIENMLLLDRWIVDVARVTQDKMIVKEYEEYEFHRIYQNIHNFCVLDLGGYYLDIIKDRQYTTKKDSNARRSAQTAIFHVLEAMVRWFAPILSFTAEEIWNHMPDKHQRGESIFLEKWYSLEKYNLFTIDANKIMALEEAKGVREAVGKELEKLRIAGAIGSSLDAEADVYCGESLCHITHLEDELRFVLITSYARVHPAEERPADAELAAGFDDVWIKVMPSAHKKCIRCWHHREDVGANAHHPEICLRCVSNIEGDGEVRRYA